MIEVLNLDGKEWVSKADYDALDLLVKAKVRSVASHHHQFAEIGDLFENIPEQFKDAPWAKSADSFRKHGLIQCGYCNVDTLVFDSKEAAIAAAPFIANLARKGYGYAITVVRDCLVVCTTPHSQKYKAMGKATFDQSKTDVLNWAHQILETGK